MWETLQMSGEYSPGTEVLPSVSFEFFPPKSEEASENLRRTVDRLAAFRPSFVSVTCGANGSSRSYTPTTIHKITQQTNVPVVAHMTCVGISRGETEEMARSYWDSGIRHIVALRGDRQNGSEVFEKHPNGFGYAAELVAALKRVADFEISVAAYPEVHPEAVSSEADLENLKRKADAGATRAITQFFFDTDTFFRFVERARAAGISIPIVPGIMPLHNYTQVAKFARGCGTVIPSWLTHIFEGLDQDPSMRQMVAAAVAAEHCRILRAAGFHEFHFYTLNRAELTSAVCHLLGLRPRGSTVG